MTRLTTMPTVVSVAWPNLLGMVQVAQPETILRWHRAEFKAFWQGTPSPEVRDHGPGSQIL